MRARILNRVQYTAFGGVRNFLLLHVYTIGKRIAVEPKLLGDFGSSLFDENKQKLVIN